jgi:hypothetical protein
MAQGYKQVTAASYRNFTTKNADGTEQTKVAYRLFSVWIPTAATLAATIDPDCPGHTLRMAKVVRGGMVIDQGQLWADLPNPKTKVTDGRCREYIMTSKQLLQMMMDGRTEEAMTAARTALSTGTVYHPEKDCSKADYEAAKAAYEAEWDEIEATLAESCKAAAVGHE